MNFIQKSRQAHMSISPRSGARGLQRLICLKSYTCRNGKLGSLYGSTLPKRSLISKKASNKSCLELNSIQKNPWAHMSISPRSGVGGSKDFPFLYILRFQTYWFLELASSTPGGGRHMRLRTCLYEIQF